MDMKKNWEKCALALIFGIVTILYFIALVDAGFSFEFLGPLSIATLVFLLGLTVYYAVDCCMPQIGGRWALVGTGVINFVLIVIAFINIADTLNAWAFNSITATFFVPLAIYALLPLILGIKKVLDKEAA